MRPFSPGGIAVRAFALAAATVGLTAAVAQITDLPDAPGRETLLGACVDCHQTDTIRKTRRSPEQWAAVVERMVGYGAALSAEEQAVVVQYLGTHLGSAAGSTAAPASGAPAPLPAPGETAPSPTPVPPVSADPAAREPKTPGGTF